MSVFVASLPTEIQTQDPSIRAETMLTVDLATMGIISNVLRTRK